MRPDEQTHLPSGFLIYMKITSPSLQLRVCARPIWLHKSTYQTLHFCNRLIWPSGFLTSMINMLRVWLYSSAFITHHSKCYSCLPESSGYITHRTMCLQRTVVNQTHLYPTPLCALIATYQTHLTSYTTGEYRVTSYTTYYTQYNSVCIVFYICLYRTVIIRAVVLWRGKLIWPPLQSCNILYQ